MPRPNKQQRNDLAAAFSDFDTMYGLLMDAEGELLALDSDIAGVSEQLRRIAAVKTSVQGVKRAIAQIGDAYASILPLFGNVVSMAPKSVLLAIKGGTAALSAMNYDARQFLRGIAGELPAKGSFAQVAEWGALGAMAGIINQGIR